VCFVRTARVDIWTCTHSHSAGAMLWPAIPEHASTSIVHIWDSSTIRRPGPTCRETEESVPVCSRLLRPVMNSNTPKAGQLLPGVPRRPGPVRLGMTLSGTPGQCVTNMPAGCAGQRGGGGVPTADDVCSSNARGTSAITRQLTLPRHHRSPPRGCYERSSPYTVTLALIHHRAD
jgi:hypothetical protein